MKEVFKLFFSALDRSWRKKKAEILLGIFLAAILFMAEISHVIPAFDINVEIINFGNSLH